MVDVSDLPITKEYTFKPNVECVASCTTTHTSIILDKYSFPEMRNHQLIFYSFKKDNEDRVVIKTFLGSRSLGNQESVLTSSEINSMSLLNASYRKELIRLKGNAPDLVESSKQIFSHVSKSLYRLPFQNCAVEVNSDQSIKFTLLFPGDRLLMVTKFSSAEVFGLDKDKILYSFFINRKLVASDVANLEVFTKNFKGYISE